MTFDLTSEQAARVAKARDLAARVVAPAAAAIDTVGELPGAVTEAIEAARVWDDGPADAVLVIEELAAVSGSAAAWAALGGAGASTAAPLAGLRGVGPVASPTDTARLGLAAVCVGIGRAAVDEAVSAIKAHGDRPTGDVTDPPHWTLADAATEVDAARLLVRAAASEDGTGAAAALVFAGGAASRAVDAAVRVIGAGGWQHGALLERCGRDVQAALLILGTEDEARRVAADRLLSS